MNNYNNTPHPHDDTAVVERQAHRDPITGTPGAHPLGTALGAAPTALAGTIVGAAVGGPVGMVLGAAAGALAGGAVGHEAAETVNPTLLEGEPVLPAMAGLRTELEVDHLAREEALGTQRPFETHAEAYRLGINERMAAAQEQPGTSHAWNDQVEARLKQGWESTQQDVGQAWTDVKASVKSAWDATSRRFEDQDRSD